MNEIDQEKGDFYDRWNTQIVQRLSRIDNEIEEIAEDKKELDWKCNVYSKNNLLREYFQADFEKRKELDDQIFQLILEKDRLQLLFKELSKIEG